MKKMLFFLLFAAFALALPDLNAKPVDRSDYPTYEQSCQPGDANFDFVANFGEASSIELEAPIDQLSIYSIANPSIVNPPIVNPSIVNPIDEDRQKLAYGVNWRTKGYKKATIDPGNILDRPDRTFALTTSHRHLIKDCPNS